MRKVLITFMFLITSSFLVNAGTINIPADYSTIQAGLNAADSSDTVLVQPGTYYENIFWPDKNGIKLISAGDSSNTIIDGGGASSVIYINITNANSDTTIIEGFKIQNGGGASQNGGGLFISGNVILSLINISVENNNSGGIYYSGSGVLIIDSSSISNNNGNTGGIFAMSTSSPTLRIFNSKINYNTGSHGGGIRSQYVKLLIESCSIIGNISNSFDSQGGGGIYIYGSETSNNIIRNTLFKSNLSKYGGGLTALSPGKLKLENVEFIKNEQSYGSLYISSPRDSLVLENVILCKNKSINGGGIYISSNFNIEIVYKNINIHCNEATLGAGMYVRSPNNPFDINNISFSQNIGESILEFSEYDHSHKIDNVSFSNNFSTNYAVLLTGSSTISNSNFLNNGLAVNNILTPNHIEAIYNYWGHPSGPYHPTQNTSGQGDSTNAFVNITPWLTEPNTVAPPIPVQNLHIGSIGNDFIDLSWGQSPLGDLSGYKICYKTDANEFFYTDTIDVGNVTSCSLSGLSAGSTYYIAAICYDTDGNNSWYSEEVVGTTRIMEAQNLDIGGDEDITHLTNHTPIITFDYYDSMGETQTHYYIQISSYVDFNTIDLWNTGEIASDATSVVYDGNTLEDGQNYYLRLKVANGDFWSDWLKIQFRMNSKPSIPVLVSPINNKVSGIPVVLKILNSTDAENDNLTYSFNIYSNSVLTEKIDSVTGAMEATDTTSWQIITTLIDNGQYWWTASANDGYEESTVSDAASFLLNYANDAPNAFSLLSPADSADVITLTPLLDWEVANDPDPLDSVSYNLYFGSLIPDLQLISVDTSTSYRILYPLSDNTNYYWKVIAKDLNGATTENTGGYRLFRVNTENEFPNPFSLITPTEYSVEIDLTPIFVWENNGDPDGDEITFNLYYSIDSSFTETVPVTTDSNNFIPVDSLMDNSTYFWKVIAKDSGLLQTETDTWCFWTNTELEPPNQFDLLLPKDGENCLPIVPEFVWSKATDNDPNDYAVYNLLISKDNTFSEVDVFVEGLTDTLFVLTEGLDDNNQYYWKIEAIDTDSLITSSEVFSFVVGTLSIDDLQGIPTEYSLSQNYPNPFNPTTTISYQLPKSSFVKLSIYDISGRLVDKLIDEKKNAGYYSVEWNAENVCSGVYFYRIEADNFVAVKKGLLVK